MIRRPLVVHKKAPFKIYFHINHHAISRFLTVVAVGCVANSISAWVKRTNLKKLDTTKSQQPTKPFSNVEIANLYERKIQRMLEICPTFMHCPLLGFANFNFILCIVSIECNP